MVVISPNPVNSPHAPLNISHSLLAAGVPAGLAELCSASNSSTSPRIPCSMKKIAVTEPKSSPANRVKLWRRAVTLGKDQGGVGSGFGQR